jgi:hypothetical protein
LQVAGCRLQVDQCFLTVYRRAAQYCLDIYKFPNTDSSESPGSWDDFEAETPSVLLTEYFCLRFSHAKILIRAFCKELSIKQSGVSLLPFCYFAFAKNEKIGLNFSFNACFCTRFCAK